MAARYKVLLAVACSLFLCASLFADQAVNVYVATTPQSPVGRGCEEVLFHMIAFTGTIGNATYGSATTAVIEVRALGDNKSLNAIPYTVTSGAGSLIIYEVR